MFIPIAHLGPFGIVKTIECADEVAGDVDDDVRLPPQVRQKKEAMARRPWRVAFRDAILLSSGPGVLWG